MLSSSPSCLSTPARRCARAHAVCLCRGAPPRRIRRVHSSWRPDPSRPGRRSRWEDASCRCLPDGSMAGAEEPTPLPGSAAGSYPGSSAPPKKPVEGGSHRAALVTGRAPPTLGSSAAPRAGPPAPVRGTPVMLPCSGDAPLRQQLGRTSSMPRHWASTNDATGREWRVGGREKIYVVPLTQQEWVVERGIWVGNKSVGWNM